MYEQVTSYLGKLKPAHWKYPEDQGNGTSENPYKPGWPEYDETTKEFMHKMYEFVPNEGQNYDEVIYKATGLDCHKDLSKIDVSKIDGDIILYMIFSMVRGERFSDGLFGSYVANGTIDRMLTRLKKINNSSFEFIKKLINAERYKDYKKDEWGGCDVIIVSEKKYNSNKER